MSKTIERTEASDENSMSIVGKVSLSMSNSIVIKNLVAGSWLDLLCGYNPQLQLSQINNDKINKFVCLDFKINNSLLGKKIQTIETTIDKKLDFPSESFDNLTVINGLEHLWSNQDILNECFRLLKKGGVLQIVVPTWAGKPFLEFLAFRLKDEQANLEMDDHKLYYDEKTLWPMLVKAGFKPQKISLKRIKFRLSLYAKASK